MCVGLKNTRPAASERSPLRPLHAGHPGVGPKQARLRSRRASHFVSPDVSWLRDTPPTCWALACSTSTFGLNLLVFALSNVETMKACQPTKLCSLVLRVGRNTGTRSQGPRHSTAAEVGAPHGSRLTRPGSGMLAQGQRYRAEVCFVHLETGSGMPAWAPISATCSKEANADWPEMPPGPKVSPQVNQRKNRVPFTSTLLHSEPIGNSNPCMTAAEGMRKQQPKQSPSQVGRIPHTAGAIRPLVCCCSLVST